MGLNFSKNQLQRDFCKRLNNYKECILCGHECQSVIAGLFDDRFGSPGSYDIVHCCSCGLEQTWPRPAEQKLKALYEKFYNYGGERETTYTRIRERFLNSALYRFWSKREGDISFHFRQGTGRLLDIGCNEGRSLTLYARSGFQAEGLELNEEAAKVARERGFTVYTEPLAQFTLDQRYQVVVLSNVLEHATDPVAMLSQIKRLLLPEGEIWISCPNADSYWRRIFGRHWINWHVPFHLFHFSPRTLQETLAKANLHLVNMKTCTPAAWLVRSFCAKIASRAGRANKLLRSAPVMAGLMLTARILVLPFLGYHDRRMAGDCLIVSARPET